MTRFKNIFIAVFAYVCSFYLCRKQNATVTNGSTVAIIHTGKLGDMVCATPMIQALVSAQQGFVCCVASNSINKEILAHNTSVGQFIVWPKSLFEKVKSLRRVKPNVVCITTPNFDSLVAAIFSGAHKIIAPNVVGGYSPYMTIAYRILLSRVVHVPFFMNEYVPQQYINLLAPLGIISQDTTKKVFYSNEALKFAQIIIKKDHNRAIGLALGAGNDIKQWPIKKFVELTRELLRRNITDIVYIFGGAKEKDIIQDFRNHFSTQELERIISVSDVSIDELKACISRLDLFVGVDTGPIYIAEAFNIPLVDIIGPVSEKEQPPQGPNARLVYLRDRKKPEIHIMNSRVYNVAEARRQIEEITVEMVLKAIDELLPKSL